MSLPPPPQPDPARTSLFLDIDGTLAEFKRRPEEVGPTPRLTALLQALGRRLDGRIAVISGRALADMDRITAGAVVAASGVHGLEHRDALGRVEAASPHPGLERARGAFTALVQAHPELLLEDKGLGLVLHYRTAPELAELANATAARMVDETGLALQKGDMMAEVRTPGRNKGDALRTFMAEPPFQGGRPVFVGDDLTDESAFEAARDLGGHGVLVGPQRETAAAFRLDDVASVLGWLEAFAAADLHSLAS
ncbi:trehalose-phosphatase [Caulobacter sp. S45]|uniref:trehalose-phosphatase n=1 Tax=Caulobacter sp. S45 TaxID=1641861 RepID=UPI0015752167|nr:trehalose-phosphatase [Caulobacter sp. S45]